MSRNGKRHKGKDLFLLLFLVSVSISGSGAWSMPSKEEARFEKTVPKIKTLNYSPTIKMAGLGVFDQKTATETTEVRH
jgi:hypothetical protein